MGNSVIEVPVAPLRGPAGLEGVLIDSCSFTDSVGKKEPRPPLYTNKCTGNIFLVFDGPRMVYIRLGFPHNFQTFNPEVLGVANPYLRAPDDTPYTGEITPAMWVHINKWWKP